MSDYERHSGTIEKVNFVGTLEEFANSIGIKELPKYYDNFEEYFADEITEYQIHNGEIYKIKDKELDNSYDVFDYRIEGNKIRYDLCFYNGGTCLSENIADILDAVGDISQTQEEQDDSIEFKEDIVEVSYSDDFWYALNNGYIDLDAILVENEAKQKLIEAISVVEDFQYLLESQDFFVEI